MQDSFYHKIGSPLPLRLGSLSVTFLPSDTWPLLFTFMNFLNLQMMLLNLHLCVACNHLARIFFISLNLCQTYIQVEPLWCFNSLFLPIFLSFCFFNVSLPFLNMLKPLHLLIVTHNFGSLLTNSKYLNLPRIWAKFRNLFNFRNNVFL